MGHPPSVITTPLIRRLTPLALFLLLGLRSASGQSLLIVEYKEKPQIVRAARRERPMVEVNGKLVAIDAHKFALKKVDEYLPVFVSVRHVRVRTSQINLVDSGQSINHQFEFHADFSSAYPLDNVFVVLELNLNDGSKSLFLNEVGKLGPDHPRNLDLAVRTSYALGEGRYNFHVFVDGMEALHSQQPFSYRESALDRMVAKRSKDRPDSPPDPPRSEIALDLERCRRSRGHHAHCGQVGPAGVSSIACHVQRPPKNCPLLPDSK